MNFLSLIESKREGQALAPETIRSLIREFTGGKILDYQMAAMLMAIYFRGLNTAETTALTLAMRDSGDVLKFPKDKRPLVDKHSTGGVGDKVSLPLAPLLACLGFRVPMISGRGLGITGGTLDKLDSIPGFKTTLPTKRIVEIVQTVGCVICGQTDRMVPADKKLYALRDVTGTVPSIPLIVASILSKKLAESLDALVLDVKYGRAAFMQTKADARKLVKAMVSLGNQCGVNTRAILTDMNTPLGRAAGNWLEVKESVAVLDSLRPLTHPAVTPARGEGHLFAAGQGDSTPQSGRGLPHSKTLRVQQGRRNFRQLLDCASPLALSEDLRSLVLAFAAHLLVQTGKTKSLPNALKQAEDCLNSGTPRQKWDEMLAAQGADLDAFNKKLALDHTAPVVVELKAAKSGFVSKCDARIIGEVIRDLGGGRLTKESVINCDAGVDQLAKPGEKVKSGDVLVRLHAADGAQAEAARTRIKAAFQFSSKPPKLPPLVVEALA